MMVWVVALVSLLFAVGVCLALSAFISRYQQLTADLAEARAHRQRALQFQTLLCSSLASVPEVDHAMQMVAKFFCEAVGADSLAIYTVDTDPKDGLRKLRGAAVHGMYPAFSGASDMIFVKAKYRRAHLRHEYTRFGDGIVGGVAQDHASILVRTRDDWPRSDELPAEARTLMAVPMIVERHLIGVMCAVNCSIPNQEAFTAEDVARLEDFSHQAALASNLVHIYTERAEQERIRQELELGREIQESLLPSEIPSWGDYQLGAASRAAREVGGDFYNFIQIDDDRLMVLVADAAGKGVPACLLIAMCNGLVRTLADGYSDMSELLEDLNRRLFTGTDETRFITMAMAVIDKKNNICEYGSAGHTPVLVRQPDGAVVVYRPEGAALGILPEEMATRFETIRIPFPEGTSLLIITDGVTEALNVQEEEFGVDRLRTFWGELHVPSAEAVDAVLEEVGRFAGNTPQDDDQTVAVITR